MSFSEPKGASHHSKNASNSEITCQVVPCLLWKQSTGDMKDGLSCIQPRLDDRCRVIRMWLAIHVAIFPCNLLRVHHGRLDEARLKQPRTLKCGSLIAIGWPRRLGSVGWCGMNEEVNLATVRGIHSGNHSSKFTHVGTSALGTQMQVIRTTPASAASRPRLLWPRRATKVGPDRGEPCALHASPQAAHDRHTHENTYDSS